MGEFTEKFKNLPESRGCLDIVEIVDGLQDEIKTLEISIKVLKEKKRMAAQKMIADLLKLWTPLELRDAGFLVGDDEAITRLYTSV